VSYWSVRTGRIFSEVLGIDQHDANRVGHSPDSLRSSEVGLLLGMVVGILCFNFVRTLVQRTSQSFY
jgi:hypothetical protein